MVMGEDCLWAQIVLLVDVPHPRQHDCIQGEDSNIRISCKIH